MGSGLNIIKPHSRSALFLTELILAILIFTLCMGICGGVFVRAYEASSTSTSLNHAVIQAQNAAEVFQARPEAAAVAERLEGRMGDGDEILVYYDSEWNVTKDSGAATFTLKMLISGEGALKTADITVFGRRDVYRLTSMKNVSIGKGWGDGRIR